jgi:hypothetical protein
MIWLFLFSLVKSRFTPSRPVRPRQAWRQATIALSRQAASLVHCLWPSLPPRSATFGGFAPCQARHGRFPPRSPQAVSLLANIELSYNNHAIRTGQAADSLPSSSSSPATSSTRRGTRDIGTGSRRRLLVDRSTQRVSPIPPNVCTFALYIALQCKQTLFVFPATLHGANSPRAR